MLISMAKCYRHRRLLRLRKFGSYGGITSRDEVHQIGMLRVGHVPARVYSKREGIQGSIFQQFIPSLTYLTLNWRLIACLPWLYCKKKVTWVTDLIF